MSAQQIKYTVDHYRKEGVSEEALLKWFHEVHIPNAVPLMKKHGITKYAAHTRAPELCDAFQVALDSARPEWEISKADVVLEFWMPDMKCLSNLFLDPEWTEKAVKNQEDWINETISTVHIGYDTVYLED
ncbi:hypothetical protein GGR54DRAFT_598685 [Hypoxylon sp. NC1633]|nr:hypothetical protein GGR54DRAFT_598685 [Hypoxylon sp. NC1633]